jgi:3-hydroxyisobutyrate dehydrogenase-like beta-hydroxyacid dehydrogenase
MGLLMQRARPRRRKAVSHPVAVAITTKNMKYTKLFVSRRVARSAGTMTPLRIGFIGFGEVGSVFAAAIAQRGAASVAAYDALFDQAGGAAELQKRAANAAVRFLPRAELVRECDWIVSTVTTTAALAAAQAAAGGLGVGKTYVDLNSTAPAVKQEVARVVGASGAHFVEGAILSAIGVSGAAAKILIGDADGPASAEALARCGLNAVFYSREIGRAAAFKLLRSVFSKGMEALLIEFLVAGHRAGLQDDLWREVVELFDRGSFERTATNWVASHATAHERRYHEVSQVVEELRALGVDPIMTAAAEEVFRRSGDLRLKQKFSGHAPTRDEVIARLARATQHPFPPASPAPSAPPSPPASA